MGLLNYTTKIDPDKTAQEISRMLAKAGAIAILTEYDETSEYIVAISFRMKLNGKDIGFKIPCDWKPVYEIMYADKNERNIWDEDLKRKRESDKKAQAIRTAWRIVKDWVEAQLAIIQTKMVKTEQVFLPYAIMRDGKTFFERVETDPQFLLGSGNDRK